MATNLPTDIDATFPDRDPGDAEHQRHHDAIHAYTNDHDTAPDPHAQYHNDARGDARYMVRETAARTVYVATTGSDATGDGSSGKPWATIQHAVNQARSILYPANGPSGYKIIVNPGTYVGAITVPPVLLGGVDTAGNGGIIIQSSTLAYADVTIRGGTAEAGVNIFGTCSLRGVTVEADNIGVLVRGGAAVQAVVRECRIRRQTVSNGGDSAIYTQFAAVFSHTNVGETGRLFANGLRAFAGGVISKYNATQPSGGTTNENASGGGVIR